MNTFDYLLIAIALNIFAIAWVAYKLYSIDNDNKFTHTRLGAEFKRIEQLLSSEFNNSKSNIAKISNKLDGITNKLDNIKKIVTGIESLIKTIHVEEQRLMESNNDYISNVSSELTQNAQSTMSKFKNITHSVTSLNQLLREVIEKMNQVGYGIDSICTIQTNNHKILVEKIYKNRKTDELGFQQVQSVLISLQNEIISQGNHLKPLNSLILELTELYASLDHTIDNIYKGEKSLSNMANKHEDLIDCVRKLNKTSIDVFEILKLYILNCTLSPFEKNLTKRSR